MKVLEVFNEGGVVVSGKGVTYVKGEIVYPDSYDGDRRKECTHGIHFFLDRAEAEDSGF